MKNLIIILSILISHYHLSDGQGLIPQDLYDAGLNLGYLEVHSERGTAADTWSTWASNAGNEFASAWGLTSVSIPQPPFPSGSFTVRNNMVQYMMSNASGQCMSPYFQSSLNIFNAGYNMGRAFALTNYNCTGCVQSALYTYAINLESVSQSGIPGASTFMAVAGEARILAMDLNGINTEQAAREALAELAGDIQGNIITINGVIPNELQPCNSLGSGAPFPSDMSQWKTDFGPYTADHGQIDAKPPGDGRTSYYVAPSTLHGNWTGYRLLVFDKMSWGGNYYGPDRYGAYGDVVIRNGSRSARYDIPADHSKKWMTFEIPLYNDGNWVISRGSSLEDVLRNITELKIRAEYGGGTDYSSLRNLQLVKN